MKKILNLSLLIFLTATNSFAAVSYLILQQKKGMVDRMANDLNKVKLTLQEIKIPDKPEGVDVKPDKYDVAKSGFETARGSIFTQIKNLVGEKHFDNTTKDLGGFLKEFTEASTSEMVDTALKKVMDTIKTINEKIEKVKYYVTWILKSGLEEYQAKLTTVQQALEQEIKKEEGSPAYQLENIKLEKIDETVAELLILPPETDKVLAEQEKKAIAVLKVMADYETIKRTIQDLKNKKDKG